MTLVGILIAFLFKILVDPRVIHPFWHDSIAFALVTVIIWEGNLRLDHWLNLKFPWIDNSRKRLIIQVVTTFSFTFVVLFLLIQLGHELLDKDDTHHNSNPFVDPVFLPGILVALTALSIDIGYQFFKSWKDSLLELEKYKVENKNAQLLQLKSQLNPHFLFNNLSVLSSLVYKNQDQAVNFINELSKVYRYVLDNKNEKLVSLQEELEFIDHYIYLLKIRFESGLEFSMRIGENLKSSLLPPMCLQILIENTFQHNEISQGNPLSVFIYTKNDYLIIENEIQPRSDKADSSKTGLKNIISRYSYFTDQKVIIQQDDLVFKVMLPLISAI